MIKYAITNERYQKFNIDFRGTNITLVIYYNSMDEAWYRDAYTEEGTVIFGEKLVSGVDMGFKFPFKGVYIADGQGNLKDPSSDNWDNLFLYILDEDELEDQPRAGVPDLVYLIDADSNPIVDSNGYYIVAE